MTVDRPALCRSATVSGRRTPDDVWDRYLRPQRWPEWSPQIRAVDYATETLVPLTTGNVHGPAGVRAHFRILDVDATGPVRSWSWSVTAAGVRLHLRHTVEPLGGGTRTGLVVRGFAPAVLLYVPLAWAALRRLVQ
ncbi:SRPBCC family protein [Actinoplanes sp. DH11]|uniref:SRPBCC family protein n=1 Tax=Actinoplanes sp. DH11 TaxID=2857011 RepID=UPI001E4217CA|nr:SRPBCC family protein [Actinoplanes sp. DH11]